MTDLAVPPDAPAPAAVRLEPVVFAHARVAMVTTTTSGVVVDVNEHAAGLFGRHRHELVQEPIGQHVASVSGRSITECLPAAASAAEAQSLGVCRVARRGGPVQLVELVASSGCRASGRELVLLQLVPLLAA